MHRRSFITRAGLVAAASTAATALAAPAIAQANPKITWRLTSSYPKSLDTLFGISTELSNRIAEITEGNFQIQVFAPGEIVPGLQALDAVQAGTVECAHTLSTFYVGKNPAFAFDTSLPFGLNTRQHNSWLFYGGGLELVNDFLKQYNVHAIPAGNTGAQMGGWYRKEIKSLDDLKGLKMRIAGVGGTIMSRLGVIPQQIAGGDIYASLEKGTIDAVEFSGPYDDEKLGFYKVAPYYYAPGWWEGTANVPLYVNLDKWNELPKHYQAAIEAVSTETLTRCVAKYDARNPDALYRLVANGAQLRTFPNDVLEAAFRESRAYYTEVAAQNADFKKFYDNWLPYWQKEQVWFRFAELPFDAMASQHAQVK
ncbi:TRAP transporter substrate-binding protein [Paenirhodobacter enshiensis]|uniref:ABC transporter substrate-binding protein n=1 Tax=Paenirhodobacter enshiensis TaxID=1105367 RepID=A0A086XS74_9RHOB|nr:TRAP transporter substrate-binding protein DctP [Paenirhodobacter enshiensis]KFI24874.1 ABC transporter substrate-binding protein [Paenirhodobacter enshiensis]